jgi:hypothetical protein
MKRIILIIFLAFLIASPCLAFGPAIQAVVGVGGVASKDMCSAASDASLLCEDFEGASDCGNDTLNRTNCRNAYTVTEGGTSVFDAANAHSETFHCSTSTKDLLVTRGDSNVIAYKTITSSSTLYALFYIKPVAFTTNTNTTGVLFTNNTTTEAYILVGSSAGGVPYIAGRHRNQSNGIVSDTSVNVSHGTWYKVEMKWIQNQAANGWSITVDGVDKTGADTSTMDVPLTRFYHGSVTNAQSYELDNIKVHTSAPACAD